MSLSFMHRFCAIKVKISLIVIVISNSNNISKVIVFRYTRINTFYRELDAIISKKICYSI